MQRNIISEEQWAVIITVAIQQAAQGDAQARRWLSDHFKSSMPNSPTLSTSNDLVLEFDDEFLSGLAALSEE